MATKNLKYFGHDLNTKSEQTMQAINTKIPQTIGEMLVDGFRQSFDKQRFNDNGEAKWKEVQRRIEGSGWYGFNYRTNGRVPVGSRGKTASGKPRRFGIRGGVSNFSPQAASRSILLGSGSVNLRDSIYLHTASRGRVIVASDQPHAEVHNEGEKARIFGKKEFTMPKRQFMGTSGILNNRAGALITKILKNII